MKSVSLNTISALVMVLGFSVAHAEGEMKADKAALTADKTAVVSACADEAKTAGCKEGETVGTGLLKCFHAYKKDHKDFQPKQACKDAIAKVKDDHVKLKADRQAKKEEKTEKK